MLVTKDITEQVPIPHEDGQWMQFRRLSWLEMTEAAETAERRSVKKMTQFGSEAVGAIIASHEKTAAATADTDGDGDAPKTAKAPTVASYDRESLLESGVEGAVPPFEWIVSRICEEFHCRPTEAMRELRDDRWRLTFAIIEMRAYAHAKHRLDTAKPGDVLDDVPLIDEVLDNEIALAKQIFDEGRRRR